MAAVCMLGTVLLLAIGAVSGAVAVPGASISAALRQGVCLCTNEPNAQAVLDPSVPSAVLATLRNGICFISNGGIYHNDGSTWYQLRDDVNKQIAWVDSFYLSISPMNTCNTSVNATLVPFHTAQGQPSNCSAYGSTYTHGAGFQMHGLECMCDDGAAVCSFHGKGCFSDGIVHTHDSVWTQKGSSCSCKQGAIQCADVPVGK